MQWKVTITIHVDAFALRGIGHLHFLEWQVVCTASYHEGVLTLAHTLKVLS